MALCRPLNDSDRQFYQIRIVKGWVMQSNKWPAIEVCILYHRLMIVHLVVTFHTHYFNTYESSQIHEDSSKILPSSMISSYRRAASQTSLYTHDTHTPSPQCWTFTYSPTHMFTWFGLWKSSRLKFHFNLGKSATFLYLQKYFTKCLGKPMDKSLLLIDQWQLQETAVISQQMMQRPLYSLRIMTIIAHWNGNNNM